MGEVGAALPEQQTESPCNGEVNGNCKADKMPMDASEDDSQVSSENGIVEYPQNNFSNNFKIAKAESLNSETSMLRVVSVSSLATPQDDNGDSNSKPDAKQDSAENGVIVGTSQASEPMDDREDSKNDDNENDEEEEEEEILRVQVRSNGSQEKENEKISEEIEIIESDEEEQSNSSSMNGKAPAENNAVLMQTSELKITSVQENVEQMDVSVESNSRDAQNNVNNTKEEDSAVLIQSDSEDGDYDTKDSDSQTSKHFSTDNTSQPNHTVDNTQDEQEEDDCVVIEDDDKKEPEQPQSNPAVRQRKSVMKPRDFGSYGDDDVEEIVDEASSGQPPLKRMRTSIETSAITQSLANTSQVGQITIKDARTLMGPFAADAASKHPYQQQFLQASGGKSGKEPTLVIIDTNTMPKISPSGGPIISNVTNIQNVSKTNSPYQVMPVGGLPAQGVYPINVRPSLTPINTQSKMTAQLATVGMATSPITNQNLLPALTDDMFVLEAPSFIVPYIYEKPPSDNLKEVIEQMGEEIKKVQKEEESKGDENTNSDEKNGEAETNEEGKTEETTNTENKKKKSSRKNKNPDDSWDETDTSTDDEASDTESRTKVLIKTVKDDDLETIKAHVITPNPLNSTTTTTDPEKKSDNYFESALGKFFIDIGINLVQEFVQTDLLRQQKRKRDRVGKNTPEVQLAINSLKKNLETSRKKNESFKFEMKRCEYCNFKAESALVMAHHYETPHMRSYLYKCNFCSYEARPLHDMIYHMEAMHNIKGRLEKPLSYHQCPNCPFEDNGKSKLARHAPVCAKKFRPELNLIPPHDWEAPAKIPRIKPRHGLVGTATAYQAMAAQAAAQKAALASISAKSNVVNNNALIRNRGRPQTVTRTTPAGGTVLRTANTQAIRPQIPMVLPNNYQIAGGQLIQVAGSNVAILPNSNSSLTVQPAHTIKKGPGQQPSISITPLPRQPGGATNLAASSPAAIPAATITPAAKAPVGAKPGQNPTGNKASFVICEICDGYIKDLEQLRHHMQWMHKVKIHPKMIYNRPPLNCQKCQFRFFTDQGLERHLLGSHGLVTSSMQEAANKGKDAGRCPVCGRMYQWKLLNHVSRDHHMTLKPAHLSYKCTVCTATFGMYKQFENHVYTAHSTVAKKAMDTKKPTNNAGMPTSSSNIQSNKSLSSFTSGDSLLKPLKINDEITIIPQPASRPRPSVNDYGNHVIDHSRKLKAKH